MFWLTLGIFLAAAAMLGHGIHLWVEEMNDALQQ